MLLLYLSLVVSFFFFFFLCTFSSSPPTTPQRCTLHYTNTRTRNTAHTRTATHTHSHAQCFLLAFFFLLCESLSVEPHHSHSGAVVSFGQPTNPLYYLATGNDEASSQCINREAEREPDSSSSARLGVTATPSWVPLLGRTQQQLISRCMYKIGKTMETRNAS